MSVAEILKNRVKNSDYFKPVEENVKGTPYGYVNEGGIDKTNLQIGAVIGCRNMDFEAGYDKVREPYDEYMDLSGMLPSGYKIVRFEEKQFVSGTGKAVKCMIACVKKPGDATIPLRIYVNYYWLPDAVCENAWKTGSYTPDWISGWEEITARYKAGENNNEYQFSIGNYEIPSGSGNYYQIKNSQLKAEFNKQQNYFNGWFVILENDLVGIVTMSIYYGNNAYWQVSLEDGISITGQEAKIGICRFPVNQLNASVEGKASDFINVWKKIEDVGFEICFPNVVKVNGLDTSGLPVSRPLWLGYNEREYMGGAMVALPSYSNGPTGWLTVIGTPTVNESKTYRVRCRRRYWVHHTLYIQFEWTDDANWSNIHELPKILSDSNGAFDAFFELTTGLRIRVYGNWYGGFKSRLDNDYAYNNASYAMFSITEGMSTKWDGLWFGYDMPNLKNKKIYYYCSSSDWAIIDKNMIGRELGIKYSVKTEWATRGTQYEKIYSLSIELDGYQTIFVKQVFLPKSSNSGRDDFLMVDLFLAPWFDRRISGHLLYYLEQTNIPHTGTDSAENELPETFRFNDIYRGYYAIKDMGAVLVTGSGTRKVMIINSNDIKLAESATGEMLSTDRLNNYYWKNVVQTAKRFIRVGDNIIAIGLGNDTVNKDNAPHTKSINGAEAICVSQLQSGINAISVLTSERQRQITSGWELIDGAWMTENQFLLFTRYECYWMDITDEAKLIIRKIAVFDNMGLISPDALVTARAILTSQAGPLTAPLSSIFEGVYYAGKNSIYGFIKNKPVDLLVAENENGLVIRDIWRKEYQELEHPELIKAGYRTNSRDVYFYIPELSEIRVYSIQGKHWKIYKFADEIKNFVQSEDGELMFNTDTKIYKTEPAGTLKNKDKQGRGDENDIEWGWEKIINFGSSMVSKIPDGFELNYELEGVDEVKMNVKAGVLDSNSNVLDADITLRSGSEPNKFYERRGFGVRTRGQWMRFSISSDSGTAGNVKGFKLLGIKLKALLAGGNLTRQ